MPHQKAIWFKSQSHIANDRKGSSMNTKRRYANWWLTTPHQQGLGVALACLLLPLAAGAGGVVTNCTEADLRAAMEGGGSVTFACDGTITLASTITIAADTTFDGSSHQITLSGGRAVRVFQVNTNASFTLVNLTVAEGMSAGGSAILNLAGSANLTGVSFQSNTAILNLPDDSLMYQVSGGAILNRGGTMNATNCSFADNAALGTTSIYSHLVCGGAICNESGQVNLRSSTFVANRASGGQPPWHTYDAYPGDPGRGGAIHNAGIVTLDLCSFTNNSATGGDGVTWYPGGEGSGGAIFNQGTLTMDRSTLTQNAATGGTGGVGYFPEYPWMGGEAGQPGGEAHGGAICSMGSLWVFRSTFTSNVVTGGAGGTGANGALLPDGRGGSGGAGFHGMDGFGGAVFTSNTAVMVNCTIAFNAAGVVRAATVERELEHTTRKGSVRVDWAASAVPVGVQWTARAISPTVLWLGT